MDPPTGIFPLEIFDMIIDFYLSRASITKKLNLRFVNKYFCSRVARRVFAHIIVEGHDFSAFDYPLTKWGRQSVQHLEVRLRCAETQGEQEEQKWTYWHMVGRLLDECEDIRSMEVLFCRPNNLLRDNYTDEGWDSKWEGETNHPQRRNEYHNTILDWTIDLIRDHATCSDLKQCIQVGFRCCSCWDECSIACAGRNDGIVVGQSRVDKNKLVLQSANSHDGQPPAAGDRPGVLSHSLAQHACSFMRYILHKYLATPSPGLDDQPRRWGFVAEQLEMQRHLLCGISTAVAPDCNVFVPISTRGLYDNAISGLQGASGCVQEAQRICQGHLNHTGDSCEKEILEAKDCITRAIAALESAYAAEDALAAEDQSESSNDDDEESRRSTSDDGRSGSDSGGGDDSEDEDEDDEDPPYRVYIA